MKLTRPLVFLDIESTGTDPVLDRIVSLALIVHRPDGEREPFLFLVNPGITMKPEVIAVHGITNEAVERQPAFGAIASTVHNLIKDRDIAGFGVNNFDMSILWEELYRNKIEWDLKGINVIDACQIFKIKEPRDLTAAVQFYCGREREGAHDAMADTMESMRVLLGQLTRYPDLGTMDVPQLAKFCDQDGRIDIAGKIVRDKDGDPCYNFGKVRFDRNSKTGLKIKDDPTLGDWMLGKDFPTQSKKVMHQILNSINRPDEDQEELFDC